MSAWGIGANFVSVILLPMVANAAEHANAIGAAAQGRMATAISVAVGSSVQIALGALPLLVLVGWAIGQPLYVNLSNIFMPSLLLRFFEISLG
jgi:Ca2+:H+ antiporter